MNAEKKNWVDFARIKHKEKKTSANFIEKLLISGPWLISWIYGVFQFEPSQEEFKVSFFSFLLFGFYLLLIGFGRLLVFLFFPENYLFYFSSFFSLVYLVVGIWSVVVTFFGKNGKKKNAALVSTFVDKLFQN